VETDQSATSATLGDGGIYSNLEDLAEWDRALDSHALLSEEEMRPALIPVKLNDGSEPHWPATPNDDNLHPGKPVAYGFGWFLDPFEGRPRMWHTGGTMGFRTVIERFTGERLTIVVLCNRTDLEPERLALQAEQSSHLGSLEVALLDPPAASSETNGVDDFGQAFVKPMAPQIIGVILPYGTSR
jgi:CubicO group peptidase (beta-lactamase class C family)